jgi:hypothetical protein
MRTPTPSRSGKSKPNQAQPFHNLNPGYNKKPNSAKQLAVLLCGGLAPLSVLSTFGWSVLAMVTDSDPPLDEKRKESQ